MNKIRVLHIITRFDKGGSAYNTFLTLRDLTKSDFKLSLVAGLSFESEMNQEELKSRNENIRKLRAYGVEYIVCPFLTRKINIIKDFKAFVSLRKTIKKNKPSIVHTHSSKAGFLGRIAAKIEKVPHIIHTPHGHVFSGYFGCFKTKLFMVLERLAAKITDTLIALAKQEKNDYIHYRIAKENKLRVIPSGIEMENFKEPTLREKVKARKKLGIPEKAVVVGTAGRLVPVKGPEYLVKAAKHVLSSYPDTVFIFAGDGYLWKNLEKKAIELKILKNIYFLGWREDICRIMSIYDIFVLPSLNEGMGRVLIEAMALGKPIVASNVGSIPDLIDHGKNGYLVSAKNPFQLADSIKKLIKNNKMRNKMGREGKKKAESFTAETMVKKIKALYKELLESQGEHTS